ncbi:MAG: hypothetical protein IPK26_20795 [Planctomycetes bacterium]|nr:hypothetical protein [Planctomycetota bacterium]
MNIPGRRIATGEEVYTAPFARGGDGLLLRVECIDLLSTGSPAASVSVAVYTRNKEEDWGSTALLTLTVDSTGIAQGHIAPSSSLTSGIKEQLRLKLTGSGAAGSWVLLRVLQPLFYEAARA